MKHIKFLFCMIIIISLVLITGCSREKDQPKPIKETTLETAEIISHASSGSIPPGNEITVTFVNPQIKQDMTGSTIKKKVFFFKPNIDGITRWKDRRTLAFKPNKTLPFRKTFSVEVKYNELIPNLNKQKPFLFNFTTSGREITTISGDFEPLNQNNPDLLYYKGELSFTEPIDPQTVKKAVSLSSGNSDFPLQWETKNKNKSFFFKSDTIKRAKSGQTRTFQLKIDNDQTELSKPFTKEFSLEPLGNFTVSLLRKFDQGNKPGIEIRFSDKLDTNQDITGLIRVSPTVKFLFKGVNKSVFLSGNFEAGKMYSLKIAGIRSKWGTSLKKEVEKQIDFEDKKPQFSFLKDGLFLPSANNKKIGFKTMNLKKIKVTVKKVF
ncbi:MAG: hypothetical protein GY757_23435, partial [bacterium]|nr:hypothetical protein [bacterium]